MSFHRGLNWFTSIYEPLEHDLGGEDDPHIYWGCIFVKEELPTGDRELKTGQQMKDFVIEHVRKNGLNEKLVDLVNSSDDSYLKITRCVSFARLLLQALTVWIVSVQVTLRLATGAQKRQPKANVSFSWATPCTPCNFTCSLTEHWKLILHTGHPVGAWAATKPSATPPTSSTFSPKSPPSPTLPRLRRDLPSSKSRPSLKRK